VVEAHQNLVHSGPASQRGHAGGVPTGRGICGVLRHTLAVLLCASTPEAVPTSAGPSCDDRLAAPLSCGSGAPLATILMHAYVAVVQ
jgi:hypothetical protein